MVETARPHGKSDSERFVATPFVAADGRHDGVFISGAVVQLDGGFVKEGGMRRNGE